MAKNQSAIITPTPVPPTPDPPSPDPSVTPTRFVSRAYLQSLGVDPSAINSQTASDINQVYAVINQTPWITMDTLVKWANSHLAPDGVNRLNMALAILASSELVDQLDN